MPYALSLGSPMAEAPGALHIAWHHSLHDETNMADDDWVAEVKRWCQQGQAASREGAGRDAADAPLGYEAADLHLQRRAWYDASPSARHEG